MKKNLPIAAIIALTLYTALLIFIYTSFSYENSVRPMTDSSGIGMTSFGLAIYALFLGLLLGVINKRRLLWFFLGALGPYIVTLIVTMVQNVFLDFKGLPFLPVYPLLLYTTIPYLLSYGLMAAIFYGKSESTAAFSATAPTIRRRSIVYIFLMILSATVFVASFVYASYLSSLYPSGFLVGFLSNIEMFLLPISFSIVLFWIAWKRYRE